MPVGAASKRLRWVESDFAKSIATKELNQADAQADFEEGVDAFQVVEKAQSACWNITETLEMVEEFTG